MNKRYLVRAEYKTESFDDLGEAEETAKKFCFTEREDVVVYKAHSVVKLPLDDFKVEKFN